MQKAYQT